MSNSAAERLRLARQTRGYSTASEAARALGLAASSYNHYENGNLEYNRHAARFARFFGVEVEWLLTGRGLMNTRDINQALDVPLITWDQACPMTLEPAVEQFSDARRVVGPSLDTGGDWIALDLAGAKALGDTPPDGTIFANRRDRGLIANATYLLLDSEAAAVLARWKGEDVWQVLATPLGRSRPLLKPTIIGRVRLLVREM